MDIDKIINTYQSFIKNKKPEDVAGEKDSTIEKVEKASALSDLLDDIRTAYDMVGW